MLKAYSKEKELITLVNLSKKEIEGLRGGEYFCPVCNHPVQIKNGQVKLPHFAHLKNKACSFYFEGETAEHLALKKVFAKWCERQAIQYELEKYLPALNQRPDILIGNIAIEIQCSSLSTKRLVERTRNYQAHGYVPIWICGKKLFSNRRILTDLTKNLCYFSTKLGFYLWSADWEKQEISLFFHIEEDWKKRMYATKKNWPFYGEYLLEIINFPNQANVHSKRKYTIGCLIQEYYRELNRKLYTKNVKILTIQSLLYNNHLHLRQLPNWFYYPGVHIFCCRNSDLLLKIKIWKLVQFFDQNVIGEKELIQILKKELEQSSDLFYELPNIPLETVQFTVLYQLFTYLIACSHFIKVDEGWQIIMGNSSQSIVNIGKWLKTIENNCLITATPFKSMIR